MTTRTRVPPARVKLNEIHCAGPNCGKFLGYQKMEGILQMKCHSCKAITQTSTLPEGVEAPATMREVRCPNCGRFLYVEAVLEGIVMHKCRNCKRWHTLEIGLDKASVRPYNKG